MNDKQDTLIATRKDIQRMLAATEDDRVWRANLMCSLWMVNRMIEVRDIARHMRRALYEIRAANRGQLKNNREH